MDTSNAPLSRDAARNRADFASIARAAALGHRTNHYGWMLAGEALYAALAESHRLLGNSVDEKNRPAMFETFPHAVACTLLGRVVSARAKRQVRLSVLRDFGVDARELTSIDLIDAALCAITAHFVAAGAFSQYGDNAGGYIVVPQVINTDGAHH